MLLTYTQDEAYAIAGGSLDALLGGPGGVGRLRAFIGAYGFVVDQNGSFLFKFPDCEEFDFCKIEYDAGLDLFNLILGKVDYQANELTNEQRLDGVDCEQLRSAFERSTGLYVRL